MHGLMLVVHTLLCGTVWDGEGHSFTPGHIVVDGEKITAVGALGKAPQEGAVDLRAFFCMPGFVDAHTHVTSYVDKRTDTEEQRHAAAEKNARLTIEAGVTSGRDLGDDFGDGLWLRDQINAGKVVGPRLQVACEQIGPNPAHRQLAPAAMRELVRAHVRQGCDVIKLFATTGMGGDERFLSKAQLSAAVDEAHKLGRRVAVHVIAKDAVADSIAAGADSIDHGPGTDVALAKEMKRKGITLVPTLYILRYYVEDAKNIGFSEEHVANLRHSIATIVEPFEKTLPAILKTGATVAAGSDSFMKLHGRNANELLWLVRAGMTTERALLAMTKVSAALMGWSDRVGSLSPGHLADVIALDGDPRADISRVGASHIRFVMKGGQIMRRTN